MCGRFKNDFTWAELHKRIQIDNHIDSQLKFFRVGRKVNSSRYEVKDTKKILVNAL